MRREAKDLRRDALRLAAETGCCVDTARRFIENKRSLSGTFEWALSIAAERLGIRRHPPPPEEAVAAEPRGDGKAA